MLKDKIKDVYEIIRPSHAAWVVFDSPHSGRTYPKDFKHKLPSFKMRAAEDSAVDDLFEDVPNKGGVMLRALFPRTYADLNRYETDIKRQMLSDPQNWPLAFEPTQRSKWGHGVIRESLNHLQDYLYDERPSAAEVMHRIEHYHRPYHAALKMLIDEAHAMHGQVWHVNCHSMPSSCLGSQSNTDICLGDDFGKACHRAEFTDIIKDWLNAKGYNVDINVPFSGYRLVQDYAAPAQGRHSLQIEINKAIYWNEEKDEPNANYGQVKSDMASLSDYIITTTGSRLMPIAAS
jgi:N-formylglutamate deformylase